VIFCQYKTSIAKIAAQFGDQAVRFTGDENLKQRQAAVARFQDPDSGVRYFVATMEAGGVGLNLTSATYVIIASRPLTPSIQFQAEDRLSRIGQQRRVEVIVPMVADTIDEDIQELLDEKQEAIEQVLAARLGGAPVCSRDSQDGAHPAGAALVA
jgi:SNF2 family DNA or RNA helicase